MAITDPSQKPSWLKRPVIFDTTSTPWAILVPSGVRRAYSSSVWIGFWSPERPANAVMSPASKLTPSEVNRSPSEKSSK